TEISVVIITKNEARNIEDCVRSAKALSNDVVVVDCGSEDKTIPLATKAGAKVVSVNWQCYGHSRNTGAEAAQHDWILSLDADERLSPSLVSCLQNLQPDKKVVYSIRRKNFFVDQPLRFGTPGFDKVPRLYHRRTAQWDLFPVHEKLQTSAAKRFIKEPILHYGILSYEQDRQKKEWYSWLSAMKYLQQQKKATWLKRFLAPSFDGMKSYIFQLGFLDGKKGWQVAATIAYYTWLKYDFLHRLRREMATENQTDVSATRSLTHSVRPFFAKR
ncbi:MAG TPA: glycosyltransferase family 2 protein, partial [Flavisolibacter sp.]|nr:glycosyltransferase family 2 protein [Flavisolibacter sp.]